MKAVKPFSEMPLNQRRAYLKAAQAFFKPRLLDKQGADKRVSETSNKRS